MNKGIKVTHVGLLLSLSLCLLSQNRFSAADDSNNSPPYPGGPTNYEKTEVPQPFERLLGVWSGPFRAYDLQISGYRPYWDELTFSADRCVRVTASGPDQGDVLLIGKEVETYSEFQTSDAQKTVLPAKTDTAFLIYGLKGGDNTRPFLRFVETNAAKPTVYDYILEYSNSAAGARAFRYVIPESVDPRDPKKVIQPRMVFRVIGLNDPTTDELDTRYFSLSLAIGSDAQPDWQEVIAGGKQYHSTQASKLKNVGAGAKVAQTPRPVSSHKSINGMSHALNSVIRHEEAKKVLRGIIGHIPD